MGERRKYPYFKVQTYDERSLTWKERKVGFDTLADAEKHISEQLTGKTVRIIKVDAKGYHTIRVERI